MSWKNIIFNDKETSKNNFYKNKKKSKINEINIDTILVSKKESYGKKKLFKYFIGYNDNDVIRPLYIKIS